MLVQVVLKGPSIKHRKISREQQPAPPLLQQQVMQQQYGPRSVGTLSEQQYGSLPTTASTVAVGLQGPLQPPPGPGYLPDQPVSAAYGGGMQQQQQGSRPSTNGSSQGPRRSISSCSNSSHGSRRSSRGGYADVDRSPGVSGFEPAPLQLPLQQPGQQEGYGWPPLPDSARQPPANMDGHAGYAAAPGGVPGGAYQGGWDEQAGPAMPVQGPGPGRSTPPAVPLSAAQRFRAARANQVVPIPEEYLVARNMPVQD